MRWIGVGIALLAIGCTGSERAADSAAAPAETAGAGDTTATVDTTVVDVTGPTVLAAFPMTETEAARSAAMGEALENFQRHLDRATDSLRAQGVEVHERYGATVHWRYGDTTTTRPVPPERPVYLFLSPTTPETMLLGVQTDSALLAHAVRHFRLPVRR